MAPGPLDMFRDPSGPSPSRILPLENNPLPRRVTNGQPPPPRSNPAPPTSRLRASSTPQSGAAPTPQPAATTPHRPSPAPASPVVSALFLWVLTLASAAAIWLTVKLTSTMCGDQPFHVSECTMAYLNHQQKVAGTHSGMYLLLGTILGLTVVLMGILNRIFKPTVAKLRDSLSTLGATALLGTILFVFLVAFTSAPGPVPWYLWLSMPACVIVGHLLTLRK